ncbi:MAG: sensor histidine kinase [Eubacteriales bacterium]
MFELSKLESPEFKLKAYKTDVCEYLRQTCAELISMFESAGFTYDFDIPEESIYTMIDPRQMSRVLFNLGDNTIRYNSKGTYVTVSLNYEEEKVIILFKDNGIGIPSEVAKNIFKPFVRVDGARNSQTGGTGLGLSIAHKIIKVHSGSIKLVTDINKGCEFHIILPKI